jgi:hypothetical protein
MPRRGGNHAFQTGFNRHRRRHPGPGRVRLNRLDGSYRGAAAQVVTGTYTVHCTITYSGGMVARWIASVLTGKGEVDWEPTTIVSEGSGD